MHFLKAYINGWKILLKNKVTWFLLYFFNLAFAAIAAYPFHQFLQKNIGHSLSINNVFDTFNFNLYADLSNNYGVIWDMIQSQLFIIAVIYFLFVIFLNAGLVYIVYNSDKKLKSSDFWDGCHHYFWRFMRLDLYFLIAHVVLFMIEFQLFKQMAGGSISFFDLESDGNLLNAFYGIIPVLVIFHGFLFLWQDYTKIQIAKSNLIYVTNPLIDSFWFVIKHLVFVVGLALLVSLTTYIGVKLLNNIIELNATNNFVKVLITVIVCQLIIVYQTAMKIVHIASASEYLKIAFTKSAEKS